MFTSAFKVLKSSGQTAVEQLASVLRRRQLVGARLTALQTANILIQVVASAQFSTIDDLIWQLRETGRQLQDAQPKEHTVGNIVLKLIHLIREELGGGVNTSAMTNPVFCLANFVLLGQPRQQRHASKNLERRGEHDMHSLGPDEFSKTVKQRVIDLIHEIRGDLEDVQENVAKSAKDHIHDDEIILTIGSSQTVEAFLKSAAHHCKFTVVVAESAPSYGGHEMAKSLSSAGISTFLVPDSSVYAIMSRITKVILGAHAILANGGVFATAGSSLAATAAHAHSTPVVVCAGQFKLTPKWTVYRSQGALDFENPSHVLAFREGNFGDNVDVVNPSFDYLSSSLVDVFVTNDGDHPPSSVYRLIKETYGEGEL